MAACLTVKKGEEEQQLLFASKDYAEEFVLFCQVYWRCLPAQGETAYQLACLWPRAGHEPAAEPLTALDPLVIDLMARTINGQLDDRHQYLQVHHRGGKEGIVFKTNQRPVQSLAELLAGLFCPGLPSFG